MPKVNTYTTGLQNYPAVASDALGNFVVVWASDGEDGSDLGVFGQRYASSGAPLGPEFRVNAFTTGDQYRQHVAADALGNFVVVWASPIQDGSDLGVSGQRYASTGSPLGAEFRVNTHTTGDQVDPAVASDTLGNFVVVWHSYLQDGSGYGVFGQRYAGSGAPMGPEFRVNSSTTDSQIGPAVAADSSGNFVVVWSSFGQVGSISGLSGQHGVNRGPFPIDVFGQRYDSSGTPQGPEFRVNTYTTSIQGAPSAAADNAGDFVVVWASYGQNGSYGGVFGQRFAQIVPVELMHFGIE